MKNLFYVFLIAILTACFSNKPGVEKKSNIEKPVVIANDSLEYKIIIMDPGFNTYLLSIAKPMNYYSQGYYKIKNDLYVNEWNRNVMSPRPGFQNIFEQRIDYDESIDYGLEVNYKLFNYFKFVEYKYRYRFNF